MENRKDIGKAINEKLSALNQNPNEKVWQNIHYELQKKKKRRITFFYFWSKTMGLLLLGSMVAFYFYHQSDHLNLGSSKNSNGTIIVNDTNKNEIVNGSNDKKSEENHNQTIVNKYVTVGSKNEDENNINKKNTANDKNSIDNKNVTDNEHTAISENSISRKSNKSSAKLKGKVKSGKMASKLGKVIAKKFSKTKGKKAKKKSTKKEKILLTETNTTNKNSTVLKLSSLQNKNVNELNSEIMEKKKDSLNAKKEKKKELKNNLHTKDSVRKDSSKIYRKFDLDVSVSPTYYSNFTKNSTLDNRLNSNTKSGGIKWSYGIGLSYDLTEKISVRIGYSKTNLSFTTKNASINVANYDGIIYNASTSNQSIYSASNNAERMNITQEISYSEIPLEVSYKFYDKKIGLKGTVGFSYLYLNDNSVTIKTSNGFNQEIGKTNDLSKTALSINIGAGIDYKIFKNTKIFIEPMFNYQIKAFTKNNYKPYYLGIHTGIRYSFNTN